MSSTFSNLKFELILDGAQSGQWGNTTNTNIGTAIEQAIVGMATLDSGDFIANVANLTLSNTNAAQDARALCLNIAAGAVSAAGTVNVPAIQKPYLIINGSSYTVTVKVSGQTGVAVPSGTRTVVYNNGTDVGTQLNWLGSLTLGTALPIASGGTGTTSTTFVNLATNVTGTLPVANGGSGATTAATARTNFGATTLGGNLFTITNPSAVTFPRFNADNTVSSLTAADFRTAIGAGTGGGTVSSVTGTGSTSGLTLSGTVTSTGNITLGGTVSSLTTANYNIQQSANNFYMGLIGGGGIFMNLFGRVGVNTILPEDEGAEAYLAVVGQSGQAASLATTSLNSKAVMTVRGSASASGRLNIGSLASDGSVYLQATTGNGGLTADSLNIQAGGGALRLGSTAKISAAGGFSVGTLDDPGAGAIYATGNITAYYSDDRLKTKLGGIENALDKVEQLSGFYYEANEIAQALGYKPKREVGVSAQQVQMVMPEVVSPAPIDKQYLTVDYERLVPLLIEAVKELRAEVRVLKGL